jgi:hypothetical protein
MSNTEQRTLSGASIGAAAGAAAGTGACASILIFLFCYVINTNCY